MAEIGITICVAYLLDLLFGDPQYSAHPVRMIGLLIHRMERVLRGLGCSGTGGGILLVLGSSGLTLSFYFAIERMLFHIHPALSLLFGLFMAYSCLAIGDLLRHIKPVAAALEKGNPEEAKKFLSMTVGRDVAVLSREGICRAAIETLAENFVDGFLSPLFWYFAGGLLFLCIGFEPLHGAVGCILLFKTASTLDSMVGYKDDRYLHFGWGGARLDDLMNFVPARLSILFLWLGALFTGLRSFNGLRVAFRDRLKHDSPNSAHSESFAAGALGIRLAGPTFYPQGMKAKPWLGDGDAEVQTVHVRKAMALTRASGWASMIGPMVVALFYGMRMIA
ncbi:MAG: adenosylcobinamide-phosphate synthase CbiB [Desulfobacterales bacterium]|nr:adenosylcobinamide-phosphate synthase CbiB [Desulfobacterales bacterium]